MDLAAALEFGIAATPRAFASWLFVAALLVKIVSTAVGLRRRRRGGAVPARLWWTSKLAALALCAGAALLSHSAGDAAGRALFLALLPVAALGVAAMAWRRSAVHGGPLTLGSARFAGRDFAGHCPAGAGAHGPWRRAQ